MLEINQTISEIKKYCPMCDREHDMEKKIRLVKECKCSGRDLEYTEVYYYCKNQNYEILKSKELKEVV